MPLQPSSPSAAYVQPPPQRQCIPAGCVVHPSEKGYMLAWGKRHGTFLASARLLFAPSEGATHEGRAHCLQRRKKVGCHGRTRPCTASGTCATERGFQVDMSIQTDFQDPGTGDTSIFALSTVIAETAIWNARYWNAFVGAGGGGAAGICLAENARRSTNTSRPRPIRRCSSSDDEPEDDPDVLLRLRRTERRKHRPDDGEEEIPSDEREPRCGG
eukprot:gene11718-biopygen15437